MPELVTAGGCILLLLAALIYREGKGKAALYTLAMAVLGLAAYYQLKLGMVGAVDDTFTGMFVSDNLAVFLKLLVLLSTAIVVLMSPRYKQLEARPQGEYLSLLLAAALAMMLLVSAADLVMIYLSMEFLGIASYILVGYLRKDQRSNEAAIKYFLVGAFSAAIMLYGMSLLYGVFGSTNLYAIGDPRVILHPANLGLVKTATVMMLVGFGFKIAMVPFHFWAPETYEGAPTPITAFISVAPKAAGFGVILRVLLVAFNIDVLGLQLLLAIIAAVAMTVGNLSAIPQTNIKRLLAYSSVAQVGYMLIGLVVWDILGLQAILIYLAAYLVMNLGAFMAVIVVSNSVGSDEIKDYAGLSKRSFPLSLLLALFLLSLAGIPPTVGFIGKFYIFGAAIKTGYIWLAVIGVLNSVVSLYYYYRVVHQMFFIEAKQDKPLAVGPIATLVLAVCIVLVIGLCLLPQGLMSAGEWAAYLALP